MLLNLLSGRRNESKAVTFEAYSPSTFQLQNTSTTIAPALMVSVDGGPWEAVVWTDGLSQAWTLPEWSILKLQAVSETRQRVCDESDGSGLRFTKVLGQGKFTGDIRSLLSSKPETITSYGAREFQELFLADSATGWLYCFMTLGDPETTLGQYCFYRTFAGPQSGGRGVTYDHEIPFTTPAAHCYEQMFYYNDRQTTVPVIRLRSLATSCCQTMFLKSCEFIVEDFLPDCDLTDIPPRALSQMFYMTKIRDGSRIDLSRVKRSKLNGMYGMFGLSSIASIGGIPLEVDVKSSAMEQMFFGCSKLATIGNLDPDGINMLCYTGGAKAFYQMFQDCSSLKYEIELDLTGYGASPFANMFKGCKGLTSATVSLTVTDTGHTADTIGMCEAMFSGCTGLTEATATFDETTQDCKCIGEAMFSGCTGLTTCWLTLPEKAPPYGCQEMFSGCTALTEVASMGLTTVADTGAFHSMFLGCTSLTEP